MFTRGSLSRARVFFYARVGLFGHGGRFYRYAHSSNCISADPTALNNTMGFVDAADTLISF
jgi:hypothetical protein